MTPKVKVATLWSRSKRKKKVYLRYFINRSNNLQLFRLFFFLPHSDVCYFCNIARFLHIVERLVAAALIIYELSRGGHISRLCFNSLTVDSTRLTNVNRCMSVKLQGTKVRGALKYHTRRGEREREVKVHIPGYIIPTAHSPYTHVYYFCTGQRGAST